MISFVSAMLMRMLGVAAGLMRSFSHALGLSLLMRVWLFVRAYLRASVRVQVCPRGKCVCWACAFVCWEGGGSRWWRYACGGIKQSKCDEMHRGYPVRATLPTAPGSPSSLYPQDRDLDVLLTAETHNFPCAVAPYPGKLDCLFPVSQSSPGTPTM